LTEQVEFQTALQRGNRVQVPKLVRWKFKLESDQVLKVSVWADVISWKTFYACMDKSGRITVPKVVQNEFLSEFGLQSLIGQTIHIRLAPA
jgi:bifunctional DNA-binding transcriptional regulator/antitoxin component of YhaV-PrlF toxin-antitoxin module